MLFKDVKDFITWREGISRGFSLGNQHTTYQDYWPTKILDQVVMCLVCCERPKLYQITVSRILWDRIPTNQPRLLTNQDTGPNVFSLLWKIKALPKVMITAWIILWDRIPTRRNLESRGIIVNSALCVLCNMAEETTPHLFLDCIFAHRVWILCCRWIGILRTHNKDIGSHFENFHFVPMSEKQNQVWKRVWAAIVRCIWEHKNNVVFRQGSLILRKSFKLLSWLWLKHRKGSFSYSFTDWHLNHYQCLLCIRWTWYGVKGNSYEEVHCEETSFL